MAGLLDLKNAKRIWHGGQEVTRLWAGGAAWAKPNPAPSLAAHYGTGDGQILIDWRVDEPILSGSLVESVRNDGGLGAGYGLAKRGTAPLPEAAGLTMITGGGKQLQISDTGSIDLIGAHVAIIANPHSTAAPSAILSQDAGTNLGYLELLNTFIRFRARGGTILGTITYPDVNALRLFEVRWDGTTAHLAINGATVGSVATTAQTSWPVRFIAGGRGDRPLHCFSGPVGRMVMTRTAPGYSMAAPEPAVLTARQVLAAQYGLTLP